MPTFKKVVLFLLLCACIIQASHRIIAAEQKPTGLPSFGVRLPKDLPNPHSPFWITAQKLGFVAEHELQGTSAGALYSYDIQSKRVMKLFDRAVSYPTFLPDQQRISFAAVGKSGSLKLFTISLAGQEIREYDFGGATVFDHSWSPDRRKLVFVGSSYDADLAIVNVESGEYQDDLGDLGRGTETNGTEGPDWSPNGKEIIYVGWDKSSRIEDNGYIPKISRLYKFDLRLRRYQRLTSGSFQDRWPAYSPRGKYIAFVSNRSNNSELWLVNSDGKGLRQLTDMGKQGLQVAGEKPAWSPDQKMIAFTVVPSKDSPRRGGFPYGGSTIWLLQMSK